MEQSVSVRASKPVGFPVTSHGERTKSEWYSVNRIASFAGMERNAISYRPGAEASMLNARASLLFLRLQSIRSTLLPSAAAVMPKFMAAVVFPSPFTALVKRIIL